MPTNEHRAAPTGAATPPPPAAQQTPSKGLLSAVGRLIQERTVPLLAAVFVAAGAVLVWQQSMLHDNVIEAAALQDARTYSDALRHVRTLYTTEVVDRVRDQGVPAAHDYRRIEGAIPLPTTLSLELGKRIAESESGARTLLYSPYPFPMRTDGGLPDDFARAAWAALQRDPSKPFQRFEPVAGRSSLRYATADVMRASCVDCHNSHPQSPKTDWRLGDVRGVLEVTLPLDIVEARASAGLGQTSTVLALLIAMAIASLTLVIRNLRRTSTRLEQLADVRTSELRRSEALYHSMIDGLPLSIFRKDRDSRLTFGNAAFLADMERSAEDLYGKSDPDLFPPDLARKYRADDLRVMATGKEFHDVEEHVDGGGNRKFVEVLKTPVRDHDGIVIGIQCAYWNVTERVQMEDSLRESEERYRYLANALPQIVWTTGADGQVDFLNDRWQESTGIAIEQSLGTAWITSVHPADRKRVEQRWQAASDTGEPYDLQARFHMADGSYRWHLVRALPLRDASGEIVRWFGTCTDIEDHVRAEAALRSAKASAEAANRAKSEFLANMSHEIRTPMNGIIGATELLVTTPLTERQRKFVSMVSQSAGLLLRLINDILDFSKIEAGKLVMESIRFDLRAAVSQAIESLSIRAADKGIELRCRIGEDVPTALVGDPVRLGQILVNLAGNAIKFTDEGEVTVVVDVDSRDDSTGRMRLHFAVSDTGIGIEQDKLRSIFGAFSQADTTTTRRFGGTGLGLTISAQLSSLMGGRMWAESKPGAGSTFHFDAVFDLEQGPDAEPPSHAVEGLRVLVVDADQTTRAVLREMLSSMRATPIVADSGAHALAELREAASAASPFAVVLTDVDLPDMHGLDLAAEIRRDEALRTTRMMLLAAGGRRDDDDAAARQGIEHCLTKPVKQSDLLDALLGDAEPSAAATTRPSTARTPMPALRVLLAEDGLVNQQLATILLEQAGHTVTVVDNGRAAVEAVQAERFDLVVMDVQMPEMDGLEATRAIRERERSTGGHVAIVAMTANAMQGDREQCLAAGMDGYVAKPIHIDDLEGAIRDLLPMLDPAPGHRGG